MATSAFKSTTKRMTVGNSSTEISSSSPSTSSSRNSAHRRSRSLSRFSHHLPGDFTAEQPNRGKFVNSVRGSGMENSSIDDIAANLFGSASRERGRLLINEDLKRENSSHRRGRSISRRESLSNTNATGRVNSILDSRRQRSVSVIRYQMSDSESDGDRKRSSSKIPKSRNTTESNRSSFSISGKPLRRSLSQIDLNDYSSHSSVVTDEETGEPYYKRTSLVNTAKSKKTNDARKNNETKLYEAMRKEIKNAVDEFKMELEQKRSNTRTPSRDIASSSPEKARLPRAEQRVAKTTSRRRMTDRLTEEAEKYIEDFLSNIEDTDISSIDGERSETSSYFAFPTINEVDGVNLPWLQWETASEVATGQRRSIKDDESVSSHGSWNPKRNCEELRKYPTKLKLAEQRSPSFDLEECLRKPMEEDFLFEKLRQNGNILLCAHNSFIF